MNIKALMITGLLMLTTSMQVLPCYATEVIPKETNEAASESSSSENDYYATTAYLDDEEWEEFRDKYITEYENGNTNAIESIRLLIESGGCSPEQIMDLLNRGYFTEEIDRYKRLLYIPEDYELPEDTQIHDTTRPEYAGSVTLTDQEDPNTTYNHTINETLSHEAEVAMVNLMNDNVVGNAYVQVPATATEKHINGQMLYISVATQDPLYVMFMSEDNTHTEYTWALGNCLYYRDNVLDLSVDYTGEELNFDLGDTLPSGVMLSIYTGITESNVRLNLKNSDGTIAYTLPVVDGYITIPDVIKDGHYHINKEYIDTDDTTVSDIANEKTQPEYQTIAPLSKFLILMVIVLLVAIGGGLISYGIAKKK